jgi:hypothetical protein
MFTLQDCFRRNGEEVVAKVIDGEAIIINLSNGIYYSMDQVGALIWELIEAGHSLDAIVQKIVDRYEVSSQQVQADMERLVAELCHENLLVVSNENPVPIERIPPMSEKLPYVSAEMNIYRDMGDLLALDPPMPGFQVTPWNEQDDE